MNERDLAPYSAQSKREQAEAQKLRDMIRAALPPVLSRLYQMALRGDVQAAKLLLERALPPLAPAKEAPRARGQTAKAQIADLLEQVLAGEISAKEAAQTIELIMQHAPKEAASKALSREVLRRVTTTVYGAGEET